MAVAALGLVWLAHGASPAWAADAQAPQPPVAKIAMFEFELEDVSAAASLPAAAGPGAATSAALMDKVTLKARQVLAASGLYSLVDVSKVDAKPVLDKSLRDCNGCEAAIARQLGAEQALVGVVRRISMTDYYVLIQISDCRTGKILQQEVANFADGDDGWANGVAMLLRHQLLATQD
jgi:hypothetical protein